MEDKVVAEIFSSESSANTFEKKNAQKMRVKNRLLYNYTTYEAWATLLYCGGQKAVTAIPDINDAHKFTRTSRKTCKDLKISFYLLYVYMTDD
jgi:hypothetical protein